MEHEHGADLPEMIWRSSPAEMRRFGRLVAWTEAVLSRQTDYPDIDEHGDEAERCREVYYI